MTVAPDIDPLTLALAPPPGESPQDREARIQRERDAKKRSDLIDQELSRQRTADKKNLPVKILLLGQSESGNIAPSLSPPLLIVRFNCQANRRRLRVSGSRIIYTCR